MDLYISQEKAEDWYNYINKGQKLANCSCPATLLAFQKIPTIETLN